MDSKKSNVEITYLIFTIPAHFIIYNIFTVRLIWYICIIFLVVAFLLRLLDVSKPHQLITFLATIMFPLAVCFTIVAAFLSQTTAIFSAFNVMLNERLWFVYRGITEYGIKMFGQYIQTSQEYIDENYINHYFYIDAEYGYILLNYGVIFSAILLIGYVAFSRKVA